MAYSRTTTNLQLPQYNGSDKASWLDNNTAFLNIDNFVGQQTTKNAELESGIDGNVSSIERIENEIDTLQTEQSAQGARLTGLETLTTQHSQSISKLNGDVAGLTDSTSALDTRVGANESAISAVNKQVGLNTSNINANKIVYNNNIVDVGISPTPPSTLSDLTTGTLTITGSKVVDVKLNVFDGSASTITFRNPSTDGNVAYNAVCTRVNVDDFLNKLKNAVNSILSGSNSANFNAIVSLDYGRIDVSVNSNTPEHAFGTWICLLPEVGVTLSNLQSVDDALTIDYEIVTTFHNMIGPLKNTSTSDITIHDTAYNMIGMNPVNATPSNRRRINLHISVITQGV